MQWWISGFSFNDGVCHPRHLGGERRHCLTSTIGIVGMPGTGSADSSPKRLSR
jgi:hypothetical protein